MYVFRYKRPHVKLYKHARIKNKRACIHIKTYMYSDISVQAFRFERVCIQIQVCKN